MTSETSNSLQLVTILQSFLNVFVYEEKSSIGSVCLTLPGVPVKKVADLMKTSAKNLAKSKGVMLKV